MSYVDINLKIRDDGGVVVDGTSMTLDVDSVSEIVDLASDVILLRRNFASNLDVEEALSRLDEALANANVLAMIDGDGARDTPKTKI